jgi:RNA polymerase sigma-70 factor (ECF subfamily)
MKAKEVFEILVREHATSLMVFIRSLVSDSAAAEDIFQETMMTAWKNMDRFDRERPFGPWLRGIAGKTTLAWYRQIRKQPMLRAEELIEKMDHRLTELHALSGDTFNEKLEALKDCILKLPEPYQDTIRLRYNEQLMPAAIVEQTKTNLETVKKRLNRARSMLMTCITRKIQQQGNSL